MDREGKDKLRKALDAMNTGGGTNLHAGLVLGRQEAQRAYHQGEVSRVILLSDGHANEGIVDTPQIADAARDAANHGVRITAVGIGLDFNEDLMEAIAEAGRGNYHYVKEAHDLDGVIAGELAGVQATVATNVELRLRPACAGAKIVAVHGYESRREHDAVIVPMADLFGGDNRKLLVSMTVPDGTIGRVAALHAELVYRDAKNNEVRSRALDLGVEIGTKPPSRCAKRRRRTSAATARPRCRSSTPRSTTSSARPARTSSRRRSRRPRSRASAR
jgi:Ca-activated chloride channel family protein